MSFYEIVQKIGEFLHQPITPGWGIVIFVVLVSVISLVSVFGRQQSK
jgi:hypothetical protein